MLGLGLSIPAQAVRQVGGWSTLQIAHQQFYTKGSYSAFALDFAVGGAGLALGTDYDAKWTITPSTFPSRSRLDWFNPTGTIPNNSGVWGYHHLDFGNYDANSQQVSVAPRQVVNITAFSAQFDWSYTGSGNFNLLTELWLTDTAHPQPQTNSGVGTNSLWEVGFLLHAGDYSFHNGGTLIGTTHVNNGVTYTVRQHSAGYITFASGSNVLAGTIDWKAALSYLVTNVVITGYEWVNGLAFGIEPTLGGGVGQLTVNSYGVDLQGATAAALVAPINTSAPTLSGTAKEGQTLTCSTGTWTANPAPTYAYQWRRAGVAISGATATTYTQVTADVGQAVTCAVTGTNSQGSTTAISNAVTPISSGSSAASIFSGGTMDSTAGWNAYYGGSAFSNVAGQMVVSPVGGEQYNANSKSFTTNPTAGKYYEVSIDVSSYVGGSFRIDFTGGTTRSSATFNSNGTKVFRLLANTGNTTLAILLLGTGGTNSYKLDNLTVVGPYNTATVGGA